MIDLGQLWLRGRIPSLLGFECKARERKARAIFFGLSFLASMNDVPTRMA